MITTDSKEATKTKNTKQTKTFLVLTSDFSKVTGHKINMQKSTVCLCTMNEYRDTKIKNPYHLQLLNMGKNEKGTKLIQHEGDWMLKTTKCR